MMTERTARALIKKGLLIALVGLVVYLALQSDLRERLRSVLAYVQEAGTAGLFVFVALELVACVLLLPGAVLTLGAGAIFGVVKGSILVSASATLGATAAFLVGRYLFRDAVARRMARSPVFKAIDAAVGRNGWKIVGLARLSPLLPFNLLNYAFGITGVSLRDYLLASWIGMMPGTTGMFRPFWL